MKLSKKKKMIHKLHTNAHMLANRTSIKSIQIVMIKNEIKNSHKKH